MRHVAHVIFGVGLLVMANGAVAFYFRYNFITQQRYGPSLTPIYIIGASIAILVVGLVLKTIADTITKQKAKSKK